MKILLIVKSKHIGNTFMIAEAMAEVAPITICNLEDAGYYKLNDYDIVGFGSGIYYGKHDKELVEFVKKSTSLPKYSFVISTCGSTDTKKHNKNLADILTNKGSKVIDTFCCKGKDEFFIFKLFSGLNKNHPNTDDFDNAQKFILSVLDDYNKIINS